MKRGKLSVKLELRAYKYFPCQHLLEIVKLFIVVIL